MGKKKSRKTRSSAASTPAGPSAADISGEMVVASAREVVAMMQGNKDEVSDWALKASTPFVAPAPPPAPAPPAAEPVPTPTQDAPAAEAATTRGRKKANAAPSVMGFLARVSGQPSSGKTPTRGLLGKITSEDLRAVGRGPDAEVEAPAPATKDPPPPAARAEPVPPPTPPQPVVAAAAEPVATRTPEDRLRSLSGPPPREDDKGRSAREMERLPFPVRVQYQGMGQTGNDLAENLSMRGMFIRTDAPLEVGDTVVINFSVPESAFSVTFPARVKWVNAYGGMESSVPGMGVEFSGLDDKKKRTLSQIISRLRSGVA